MVDIVGTHRLSEFREPPHGQSFPEDELSRIQQAIESVPDSAFLNSSSGKEVVTFDEVIAQNLPNYSTEGSEACMLWAEDGFRHSVDLYHPEKRIAIELEKSEAKYVWRDFVKFGRGAHTTKAGRNTIEFGCLVVPEYYSNRPVFSGTRKMLEFMEPMLDVTEVVVIGFRDPNSRS
jgi:hypothetical protein